MTLKCVNSCPKTNFSIQISMRWRHEDPQDPIIHRPIYRFTRINELRSHSGGSRLLPKELQECLCQLPLVAGSATRFASAAKWLSVSWRRLLKKDSIGWVLRGSNLAPRESAGHLLYLRKHLEIILRVLVLEKTTKKKKKYNKKPSCWRCGCANNTLAQPVSLSLSIISRQCFKRLYPRVALINISKR